MGGALKSAGGFLGVSGGPTAPQGQFGNSSLQYLGAESGAADTQKGQDALRGYANGTMSAQDVANAFPDNPDIQQGLMNSLATSATTGSKYAADQLQQNPTYSGLFGPQGQLSNTENLINQEQNQGFNLTPGDNTLYGQEAGQIANQFGQQGNQAASDLANRGLSNSGAAGAMFSGIAGNQNQMLANAQTAIAQQRFQNTQNQIAQNQNFAAQLGNQYNTALNNQYGRQLQGAQNQTSQLQGGANLQGAANNAQNQYGMQAAGFNADHTPLNFMDFASAGAGQGLQSALAGSSGSSSKTTDANGNTVSGASTAGSGMAGLFG